MEEKDQGLWYRVHGLGELALRNIIVFFLVLLVGAVGGAIKVIQVDRDNHAAALKEKNEQLVQCETSKTVTVERLMKEQLELTMKFYDMNARLIEAERRAQQAEQGITQSKKR